MVVLIALALILGVGALVWRVLSYFSFRAYCYRTGRIDGERGNRQNNYYAREWMRKAYTRGWVKGISV